MLNVAALDLRDLAESGVSVPAEPFLAAISVPVNRDNRGTLVNALQMVDCSDCFAPLFDLALDGNYECQAHALAILEEQEFRVTPGLLDEAERKLRAFIPPDDMTGEDAGLLRAELAKILSRLSDDAGIELA